MANQDPKFERWLWRSLVKALTDDSNMTGIKVQTPGVAQVNSHSDEEWVAVQPLSNQRLESRQGDWMAQPLFQVTCFSKKAELRADDFADAPFTLAGKVRAALEHKAVSITKIGEPSEDEVSCMRIGEGDLGPLFDDPDDGQIHFTVVTFRASIGQRRQ